MRIFLPTSLALVFLLLFGCAARKPTLLAPNTINEPVFHKTNNFGLGISRTQWTDTATSTSFGEGAFDPVVQAEFPVNDWAAYHGLPVYWNFLLTGEQYSDSTHLQYGKLNLALDGGLVGVSYSTQGGWKFPAALGLRAKYRFDKSFFANSALRTAVTDLSDPHNGQSWVSIGLGSQITEKIAVVANTGIKRVFASPSHYFDMYGVPVFDADITTTAGLTLDWYPTPNHVFNFTVGRFLLLDQRDHASRWLLSGSYIYVFGGR